MRKFQFVIFKSFLVVLKHFPFREENCSLGYNSMKIRDFLDISYFPKNLNLKSFGNSWGNLYKLCLLPIIMLRFISNERKIQLNMKKSQTLWPWLSANFFLLFMFLLTVGTVKSSHILNEIYFIFLEKHPKPNLLGFQYQIWT